MRCTVDCPYKTCCIDLSFTCSIFTVTKRQTCIIIGCTCIKIISWFSISFWSHSCYITVGISCAQSRNFIIKCYPNIKFKVLSHIESLNIPRKRSSTVKQRWHKGYTIRNIFWPICSYTCWERIRHMRIECVSCSIIYYLDMIDIPVTMIYNTICNILWIVFTRPCRLHKFYHLKIVSAHTCRITNRRIIWWRGFWIVRIDNSWSSINRCFITDFFITTTFCVSCKRNYKRSSIAITRKIKAKSIVGICDSSCR